jgi:SAM-dependent methyltransferase
VSDLRASWESAAADWIRWAREPSLDHTFWRMNLPALLALLPQPGRLTVDLGCGEGRVARELARLGHTVVGIEGSQSLAVAAREADPSFDVRHADAADIPLEDGAADLVVASMSLLNMDDMERAVREVARVLEPGGRLVFSTVHPGNSAKPLGDHPEAGSYFATYRYAEVRERPEGTMVFHDTHRPLSAYLGALEDAGLLIEAVREPVPGDDYVAEVPSMARWRREPIFLHVRAVKPAGKPGVAPGFLGQSVP